MMIDAKRLNLQLKNIEEEIVSIQSNLEIKVKTAKLLMLKAKELKKQIESIAN